MRKRTTITISKDLRNRIKRLKNVTYSSNYENCLRDLLERDNRYSNNEKLRTNKENWSK
jgi:Arc/MetJ family transcription regulator|tara:strand:- start:5220 stop:5396 length:177 start_codon:yes stop_codon:yes gene_type:complete